jgi:class 3 adenylate cyclase
MRHSLKEEYNQQLDGQYGLRLNACVGINTGLVSEGLLGSAGKQLASIVVAETASVASRLEHAWPEEAAPISHRTCRHVRGVLDAA